MHTKSIDKGQLVFYIKILNHNIVYKLIEQTHYPFYLTLSSPFLFRPRFNKPVLTRMDQIPPNIIRIPEWLLWATCMYNRLSIIFKYVAVLISFLTNSYFRH